MDIKIKGTVERLLPIVKGISSKGNEWVKQDMVLLIEGGQYERRMAVGILGQDRINAFALCEGEEVTCHVDIDAREYNGRWYNSINVWKVDREEGQRPQQAPQQQVTQQQEPQQQVTQQQAPQGLGDDLPF